MITKPKEGWDREDRMVETARRVGGVASKTLAAGSSGIVRIRAAYVAVICAFTALTTGWAALAAGLAGRNFPMLIGAGCFSVFLGWLAFHNARNAFGRASSSDAQSDHQFFAAGPGSPQPAEMRTFAGAQQTQAPTGGSVILYDRNRLILDAAKLLPICALLAWALMRGPRGNPLIGLFILAALGFSLFRIAILLLKATGDDLTAIAWDNQQISVRTLTASRQVTWPSVESVNSTRRVRRLWGIIPVARSHDLVFQLRDNGARRKMTVHATTLAITPGEAEERLRRAVLQHSRVAGKIHGAGTQAQFDTRTSAARTPPAPQEAATDRVIEPPPRAHDAGTYDRPTITAPVFGRKIVP